MLLRWFQWCEATALGVAVRDSLWLFPVIEAFHLVAFAVIGGAILLVDLRLLGVGMPSRSVVVLARGIQPWLLASLAVVALSGTLMFLSEATKCYYSFPFWLKMASLMLAVAFTFTVRRAVVNADAARIRPLRAKLVGLVSITLWGGVAWGGRWIGFPE
jgi:hypothetical protein